MIENKRKTKHSTKSAQIIHRETKVFYFFISFLSALSTATQPGNEARALCLVKCNVLSTQYWSAFREQRSSAFNMTIRGSLHSCVYKESKYIYIFYFSSQTSKIWLNIPIWNTCWLFWKEQFYRILSFTADVEKVNLDLNYIYLL